MNNDYNPKRPAWIDTFFDDPQRCPSCNKRLYVLEEVRIDGQPVSSYRVAICPFADCEDHCVCHVDKRHF